MSTYAVDELLRKWTQGTLTGEQALGHVLQHLKLLHDQIASLEQRLAAAGGSSGAAPPTTPPERRS